MTDDIIAKRKSTNRRTKHYKKNIKDWPTRNPLRKVNPGASQGQAISFPLVASVVY